MMKIFFHFMLKALFVFEIFTFLARIFAYVGGQLDKKVIANFEIHDVKYSPIFQKEKTMRQRSLVS